MFLPIESTFNPEPHFIDIQTSSNNYKLTVIPIISSMKKGKNSLKIYCIWSLFQVRKFVSVRIDFNQSFYKSKYNKGASTTFS